MANFNTHLIGGFAVRGVLGLVAYKAGLVTGNEFVACTLIGTAGGLLPDIDSDNSTPIKIGFDLLSLTLAFTLVIHWRASLSLVSMLALWLVCYAVVRYGIFKVFANLTVHRGIIHSVPYMAILAIGFVCVNAYVLKTPVLASWFYGLFLFIGAMTHLTLDELYSVDLLGRRLKRSSGTAMKFYRDDQRYRYLGLYALLATLLFIAPPIAPFWHQVSDPMTWWLLKDGLLPDFNALSSQF